MPEGSVSSMEAGPGAMREVPARGSGHSIAQGSDRIQDLEVLRAIAIIMVLAEHVQLNLFYWHSDIQDISVRYWRGAAGVDLFFAISGFVIARRLLPRLQNCARMEDYLRATLNFLVRRFWRLQPSAWLWAAVPLLLTVIFNRSGAFQTMHDNLPSALTGLLGINNLRSGMIIGVSPTGVTFPYWSLSLEEQFYVLLPLVAFLFRKRLMVLMLALLAWQFVMPTAPVFVLARPGAIAAGVLLAMFSHRAEWHLAEPRFLARGPFVRAAFVLIIVALIGALESDLMRPLYSVLFGLVAVLCAMLVHAAAYDRDYIMRPGLLRTAFAWVGSRSYSIYLIHIPAYAMTRELYFRLYPPMWPSTELSAHYLLVALTLTLVASELNYRLVEVPFRNYGRTLKIA